MMKKTINLALLIGVYLVTYPPPIISQSITSCTYDFPHLGFSLRFPCGAKIDSSEKGKIDLRKELKNDRGEVVAEMNWRFLIKVGLYEEEIFKALKNWQQDFQKKNKFTNTWNQSREGSGPFAQKNEPTSLLLNCGDTVYCAEFKNYYRDDNYRGYATYDFINYSFHALGHFFTGCRLNAGYKMEDLMAFHNQVTWYPPPRTIDYKMKVSFQLPGGLIDAKNITSFLNTNGQIYVFRRNIRDSNHVRKNDFTALEMYLLGQYIVLERHALNTASAIKTIEKQIIDEEKKKGWLVFPAERLQIPGSSASDIIKILLYKSYKDKHGNPDGDSAAYYILSFKDSDVKKNIPPHIRTYFILYMPLKTGNSYHYFNNNQAIIQRFMSSIKPVYD